MQWQRGGAQVARLEEELAGRLDGSVACKHRRVHAARRSPPGRSLHAPEEEPQWAREAR